MIGNAQQERVGIELPVIPEEVHRHFPDCARLTVDAGVVWVNRVARVCRTRKARHGMRRNHSCDHPDKSSDPCLAR